MDGAFLVRGLQRDNLEIGRRANIGIAPEKISQTRAGKQHHPAEDFQKFFMLYSFLFEERWARLSPVTLRLSPFANHSSLNPT